MSVVAWVRGAHVAQVRLFERVGRHAPAAAAEITRVHHLSYVRWLSMLLGENDDGRSLVGVNFTIFQL